MIGARAMRLPRIRRESARTVTITRLGAPLLHARDASTFWQRLRGLHDLPPLAPTEALILRPCRAVQTFGMREPIDVAFLDAKGAILRLVTLSPGQVAICPRARLAIEMAAGTAARLDLARGHVLVPSTGTWS